MRSVLFSEIVPRRVISDEEWLRLIEERAYQVIDRANELGPESIGGFPFIHLKWNNCFIDQLDPKVVRAAPGIGLKTRSVNILARRRQRESELASACFGQRENILVHQFVGMSLGIGSRRMADWFEVSATISATTLELEDVMISLTSPSEIVAKFDLAYLDIFRHLSHRVAASTERHLSQLKLLEELQRHLAAEDAAVNALVAK